MENQGENSSRKLWTSRHRVSCTIPNNGIDQEKLLVARNKKQCEKLHLEMFQVSAKQGVTYEEGRGITFLGNAKRTIAGN